MHGQVRGLCLLPLHVAMAVQATVPAASASGETIADLEVVEERSEEVANRLLDLSVAVRDGDAERVAGFFTDPACVTALPSEATPMEREVKWIHRHGWNTKDGGIGELSRKRIEREWAAFLEHFSEIEDARFKLKQSSFDADGRSGAGKVAFSLSGRDTDGRREWVRGFMQVRVERREEWEISEMTLGDVSSDVSAADIFSEVGTPAGVSRALPPFGSPDNSSYVWHGAAAADFDGDGFVDLFVTGADRSYLYRNERGGSFVDVSEEAGLRPLSSGTGPLALDYDDDGDTDVFIANVGAQVLLENRLVPEGKLAFFDVSLESGVGAMWSKGFSASAADVNGDGRTDVYVSSYNDYGEVVPDSWFQAENGTPNLLLVNQGDGTFREEAKRRGAADSRWSYAAGFADLDGDGKQDLYVANDFGEKGLFMNRGERFVDEAKARGALDPGNGMGVSFGDYDNDGRLDIHTTNMSSTAGNRILGRLFPKAGPGDNVLKKLAAGNNLLRNVGEGRFRDVTAAVGGFSGGWAWGGGFIDIDNDGWEDIFTPNGFISGKSMKDT